MDSAKQRGAFISYSRSDATFALAIARELRSAGYPVWLDQLDIPTGARWDDQVESALRECEIFLIILTPASVSSENVKDEIGYAVDHRKRIMPVLLKECTIPLRLRRFQYVNFTNLEFKDGITKAKQLLETLLDQQDIRELPIHTESEHQEYFDKIPKTSPSLMNNRPTQRRRLGAGVGILIVMVFVGALSAVIWRGLISSPAPNSTPIITESNFQSIDPPQTNVPPTPVPTFDLLNPDWDLFRGKVVETINSINSFKTSGTGKGYTQNESHSYEIDVEYVTGKARWVQRHDNGDVKDFIAVPPDLCIRTNGSQWDCKSGQSASDFNARMVNVVEGKPTRDGPTIIDHGSRLETYDEKQCRLYFSEEQNTDNGPKVNWRYEICFDLVTYVPVHELTVYKYIVNDAVIETTTTESRIYDINIPIDITLPIP
jgi:hypothetical protein